MTIAELTAEEARLLAEVDVATGLMEQKGQQLEDAGVFQRYASVHAAYAALAARNRDVEALKRALFLQWFAVSEPGCFTGLGDFDPKVEAEVFRLLDALVKDGQLDDELSWMLPYYAAVIDWYFEENAGTALREFLRVADRLRWQNALADRSNLAGRGQMSRYWLSINRPPNTKRQVP